VLYTHDAVNSSTQTCRYVLELKCAALKGGEMCGRYMEETSLVPDAGAGGHDVVYHWNIFSVRAGVQTLW
jgi:hypothetical protein